MTFFIALLCGRLVIVKSGQKNGVDIERILQLRFEAYGLYNV